MGLGGGAQACCAPTRDGPAFAGGSFRGLAEVGHRQECLCYLGRGWNWSLKSAGCGSVGREGIADFAGLAGGLFYICGAVSRQAAATAAGGIASLRSRRPGPANSFPDLVFYWTDSGATGRLRTAKVRSFGFGGDGGGSFHDAGTWPVDYGDRGHRAIGFSVRGGDWNHEGDRGD